MSSPSLSPRLQIGEVAERTALSLRTIRYYEDVGLLPAAERSAGGFRLYTEAAIERLLVIRQMKPLDFSLEQMAEVLTASDQLVHPNLPAQARAEARATVTRYRELALEKTVGLQEKVRAATAFAADLEQLAAS